MAKIQERTLKTRARLFDAAQEIISEVGYGALRVEEVVRRAGVAKGTFFSHFADKDALMEILIGAEIDAELDRIEALPAPTGIDDLVTHMMPVLRLMTRERYVFDVILRHSGAAAKDEIGPIAQTFWRSEQVVARWIENGPFRKDVSPQMLSDGVQAFAMQALGLHFCALHADVQIEARMAGYLKAWLLPAA